MESLQNQVLSLTTKEWVKANFGDLRFKSTWQAALDRLSEAVAIAGSAATSEQAMQVYEFIANVALIIVIGLWLAAVHNWRAWVKPGAIVVGQWVSREFQHWLSLAMLAQYE
jgi:hypothetical protein